MISIIVTHCNDVDLKNTIKSIRDTAGDKVELLVIDDCSGTDIEATCPNLALADNVIRLKHRCGVGPGRHIGVQSAKHDFVLFCDSHMRFPHGWLEVVADRIKQHPMTIFCATCVGLDKTHTQLNCPAALYHGARINWSGIDANDRSKQQVLEAVWNKQKPEDGAEIGAVMGGAYFCTRDWFLKLSALRFLRIWGQDEIMLSLSSWLAGGDCRIVTSIGVGHVFLSKGQRQPWTCPGGVTTYNKLFTMLTLLPEILSIGLTDKLRAITNPAEFNYALEMIKKDWHIVLTERHRFQSMFTRDLEWYKQKFPVS